MLESKPTYSRLLCYIHRSLLPENVWNLVKQVKNILNLYLVAGPNVGYTDQTVACMRWSKVTADIAHSKLPYALSRGCRHFGSHAVKIPPNLSRISIALAHVGTFTYICGIHLVTATGASIGLGFVNEDKQVTLAITMIRGFVTAVGSKGIHALQVIGEDALPLAWIGYPEESSVTERLAHFDRIKALEVSFDVSKVSKLVSSPRTYTLVTHRGSRLLALEFQDNLCQNQVSQYETQHFGTQKSQNLSCTLTKLRTRTVNRC